MNDLYIKSEKIKPNKFQTDLKYDGYIDILIASGMWIGNNARVKIEFDNKNLGDIFDKFGEDTSIYKIENSDRSYCIVNINLSDYFYGWIASYGKAMKIISPTEAVDGFKAYITQALQQY
jgi:hypothetical protein